MSCAHPAAHPCARGCARPVNAQYGPSYPASLSLLWPLKPNLVGVKKSAVGPDPEWSYTGHQYDADGVSVGAVPAWHAGKGVWCGPGYANLLPNGANDLSSTTIWPNRSNSTFTPSVLSVGSVSLGKFTVAADGASAYIARTVTQASGPVSISAFVKKDTARWIYFGFFSSGDKGCFFDLDTASVGGSLGGAIGRIYDTGSGVYIVTFTVAANFTTYTYTAPRPCDGNNDTTVTANQSVFVGLLLAVTHSVPMPYVPPGTTCQSAAGTSGGNGMAWAKSTKMGAIFDGQGTVACKVTLGAASSAVTSDTNILTVDDTAVGLIYAAASNKLKSNDGTNTAEVSCTWAANDELLIAVELLASTFRIGFAKAADSSITWGTAATYDGSHNSGTKLRLALLNAIPMWADGVYASNKTGLTAADIRRYI